MQASTENYSAKDPLKALNASGWLLFCPKNVAEAIALPDLTTTRQIRDRSWKSSSEAWIFSDETWCAEAQCRHGIHTSYEHSVLKTFIFWKKTWHWTTFESSWTPADTSPRLTESCSSNLFSAFQNMAEYPALSFTVFIIGHLSGSSSKTNCSELVRNSLHDSSIITLIWIPQVFWIVDWDNSRVNWSGTCRSSIDLAQKKLNPQFSTEACR